MSVTALSARRLLEAPRRDLVWPVELADEIGRLSPLVLDRGWLQLRAASRRCLSLGYGALDESLADMADSHVHVLRAGAQALGVGFERLAKAPDPDAIVAEFRTSLIAGGHQLDERVLTALKAAAQGRTDDPMQQAARVASERPVTPIGANVALAAVTRGMLGRVHAEFNLAVTRWKHQAARLEDLPVQAMVQEFSASLEIHTTRHLASLQAALTANIGFTRLRALADALTSLLTEQVPRFARVLAAADVHMGELLGTGRNTTAEELGAVCARGHAQVRECIAYIVAAKRLIVDVALASQAGDRAKLALAAPRVALEAPIPDGIDTQLHRLEERDDGKLVQIAGFVSDIRTSRDKDGLLSRARLSDPSSGAHSTVVGRFIHWPHHGVRDDCFLIVHGNIQRQSPLADGTTAVVVDRLPMAQLARQSWRIAFSLSASPWFQPLRNGTHVSWTLGPHDTAPGDIDASTEAGASEIIYLPIARSEEFS